MQHVYSELPLNLCDVYEWLSGTVSPPWPLRSGLAVRDRPLLLPLVCSEGCSPARKKSGPPDDDQNPCLPLLRLDLVIKFSTDVHQELKRLLPPCLLNYD